MGDISASDDEFVMIRFLNKLYQWERASYKKYLLHFISRIRKTYWFRIFRAILLIFHIAIVITFTIIGRKDKFIVSFGSLLIFFAFLKLFSILFYCVVWLCINLLGGSDRMNFESGIIEESYCGCFTGMYDCISSLLIFAFYLGFSIVFSILIYEQPIWQISIQTILAGAITFTSPITYWTIYLFFQILFYLPFTVLLIITLLVSCICMRKNISNSKALIFQHKPSEDLEAPFFTMTEEREGINFSDQRKSFKKELFQDSNLMCPICLNEFEESDYIVELACNGKHLFHESCIEEWSRYKDSCPLCLDIICL